TVTFSEPMDVAATAHAFSLKPWSAAGACSGTLGAAIAGATTWNDAAEMVFHPSANLTAGSCYHVAVAGTAAGVSENSLGNGYGGPNFSVFGRAPPSGTPGGGAYACPRGSGPGRGSDWSARQG